MSEAPGRDGVVVCLPDIPERVHMGELPANIDVRLVPPEPEPVPDLAEVELIVPDARSRNPNGNTPLHAAQFDTERDQKRAEHDRVRADPKQKTERTGTGEEEENHAEGDR